MDGAQSTNNAAILSSYDWVSKGNGERHVRAGFQTQPTVMITIASPAVFTTPQAHGYVAGTPISFTTTGALPTGLTAGTIYYVISSGLTSMSFEVATTVGGTAVNTSGSQSGTHTVQDGRLQFRYVDTSGNVQWQDLFVGRTSIRMNFSTFWDTAELIREMLFVDGTSNIFEWSGAYDFVTATTTNTITLTNSIGTSGFYNATSGKQKVTIRGITYTYTGTSGSQLTGVTPDPTAQGSNNPVSGDICYQTVYTTANSSLTNGPGASYANNLICTLNNQVFIGSLTSSTYYTSKVNNYTDFSYTATGRLPGEGYKSTLDANLVAFVTQENAMYICAGTSYWYQVTFTQHNTSTTYWNGSSGVTVTTTLEDVNTLLLKNSPQQGAQSQALVGNMKNYVLLLTNEPTLDLLGRIDNILGTPQTQNISDSIKLDFDSYNFTDGMVYYWRWYILVSIPKNGVILLYNLATKSWEAPQTIPVGRFYIVNGQLYGHSYLTSESYELFTGYGDRATSTFVGNPILAIANFSYQNDGIRSALKNANEFYIEGYISANTTLNCTINYEQDGNLTQQTFSVSGSDSQVVELGTTSNSLGKFSLGKQGMGTQTNTSLTGLPPKFRVIKTFPRFNYYENQFSFSTYGANQQFELLAFGLNSSPASDTNLLIKE